MEAGSKACAVGAGGCDAGRAFTTGIEELDRVLGGGLIEGAGRAGGENPALGNPRCCSRPARGLLGKVKSALCFRGGIGPADQAEALRLGTLSEDLLVLAETDMEAVCQAMEESQAQLVIIDSIQTMTQPGMASAMGSVSQIRGMCSFCAQNCKNNRRYGDFGGACDQGGGPLPARVY